MGVSHQLDALEPVSQHSDVTPKDCSCVEVIRILSWLSSTNSTRSCWSRYGSLPLPNTDQNQRWNRMYCPCPCTLVSSNLLPIRVTILSHVSLNQEAQYRHECSGAAVGCWNLSNTDCCLSSRNANTAIFHLESDSQLLLWLLWFLPSEVKAWHGAMLSVNLMALPTRLFKGLIS